MVKIEKKGFKQKNFKNIFEYRLYKSKDIFMNEYKFQEIVIFLFSVLHLIKPFLNHEKSSHHHGRIFK